MSNIPVIDMIFAILIILMIIHGYVKGFIAELFSWAGLVLALWAAVLLHPYGSAFIRGRIMQNVRYVPEVLAFIIIFLIIMLLVKMFEKVLSDIIKGIKLDGVNKFLGAVFGLVEGLALTALIVFVLAIQPFFNITSIIEDSIFAQILLPIIKVPMDKGKDVIQTALHWLPGKGIPGFHV